MKLSAKKNHLKSCRLLPSFFTEQRFEICILLLAAALRLWALDLKPPHFDEGINGFFADHMREVGFYRYDPTNYHGPLYFYALFIMQTLFGRSIWVLRMPAVLASIATVWLALRWDRFFGKTAALCGAFALAVSPAAVFYGRYAIHESWLTASLMIFAFGLFGFWKFGDRYSLFIAFVGVTLMLLLKETAVIHLACFGLAAACLILWQKIRPLSKLYLCRELLRHSGARILTDVESTAVLRSVGSLHFIGRSEFRKRSIVPSEPALSLTKQQWTSRDFFSALALSLVALFFFYSGTFLNCHGFFDLFRTLPAWIHTGAGAGGHVKSDYQIGFFNYYWIALMVRYEWPSFFGLLFVVRLLCRSSAMARYLAIYAVGVLLAYSIIPYKTPWCIISIIWPFALLFGVAVQEAWNYEPLRRIEVILVAALLLGSLMICARLNFWNFANFKEPYVYVQTSPEIYRMTDPLLEMAQKDRQNLHLRGVILLESYYPLPWMLGDFTAIGYYSKSETPQKLDADFIAVEVSRSGEIEKKLDEPYYREEFQLRDAMQKCFIYFKAATFRDLFEGSSYQKKKPKHLFVPAS